MKNLRREIQTETRILDAEHGICEYVASNQTLDYSREIILARGWKFTNFAKNSPFVDSHDYSSINRVLGKVLDWRVEGDQLIEKVQWAIGNGSPICDWGWKLTMQGILKACSVGFVPVKYVTRWDADPTAYVQQLQALGLTGVSEDKKPRCIYVEQEQIELSACILGCNPDALLKGYQDGALSEEDLFNAGFKTSGDFDFLTKSAAVFESLPDEGRAVVRAALARIYGIDITLQKRIEEKTEPIAQPADANGSDVRRTDEEFLGRYKQLINLK